MADVKISALPLATTPLVGTEVLPIVQSATTDQVTVANLTAGRAVSASSLTLTTPLSAANGGTGIASLGTGVATTLGNAINGASGFCVQDASGNLLVGTASSAGKLTVVGGVSSLSVSAAGTQTVLKLNNDNSTAGTQAVKLGFSSSNVVKSSINVAVYGNDYMAFNVGSSDAVESMRIDASGNLLVGKTSSAGSPLQVKGAGIDGNVKLNVSTTATTIFTPGATADGSLCVVCGDDGSSGFIDLVVFQSTTSPKVVSSNTMYGSPAARTYSNSGNNLQLALASGTLGVRTGSFGTAYQ